MNIQILGRTGVQVSALCLGCMMFGRRTGPRDVVRDHRPRDRSGHQLPRHRQRLRPRAERGDHRRGAEARRQAPAHRAGDQGARRHGRRRPERRGQQPPPHHRSSARPACGACKTDYIDLYQIHRPRAETPDRRDAARAGRPGPRRARCATSAPAPSRAWQLVESLWVVEGAGPQPLRLRAAAVQHAGSPDRARAGADGADLRHRHHSVEPDRRRPAERQVPPRRAAAAGQPRSRDAETDATAARPAGRTASTTWSSSSSRSRDRRTARCVQLALAWVMQPARHHQPDHRAAHAGADRGQPRRARRSTSPTTTGGDRRDRPARGRMVSPFYEAKFGPHPNRV